MKTAPEKRRAWSILCGTNLMPWVIFLQLVTIALVMFKLQLSSRIERDVIQTKVQTDIAEQQMIEFMKSTVERWEQLKNDNPNVQVPSVVLPQPSLPNNNKK